MFPMLGPPRTPKPKKNKSKPKKTVRLIDPFSPQHPSSPASTSAPARLPPSPPPPLSPLLSDPTASPFIPNLVSHSPRPSSVPSPPPRPPSSDAGSHKTNYKKFSELATEPISIVISFITRGPPDRPHGQGTELLFYEPNTHLPLPSATIHSCLRKPQKNTTNAWTFLFIDASGSNPTFTGPHDQTPSPPTLAELSGRSINRHLPSLDLALDLRLIRTSASLPWEPGSSLVVFFYRLSPALESPGNAPALATKLGGQKAHYWSNINGFHSVIENHLVATALASVCFPVALNVGYEEIAHEESPSRPDLVTLRALETLYLTIQAGYARDGFRFYPKAHISPPKSRSEVERERAFKCRVWAYWTEVVCWHLVRAKASCQVSVAYSMNKVLASVKSVVLDDKVNLEDMEKLIVNGIAREADRCREAIDKLVNHTQSELLYGNLIVPLDHASNPAPRRNLHLFTLGSSSATYGVLSSMVSHVMSTQAWKRITAPERVETLKLTIAESQPFNEGIILATKLAKLVYPGLRPPKKVLKPSVPKPTSLKSKPSSSNASDLEFDLKQLYLNADHAKAVEGGSGRSFEQSALKFDGDETIKSRLPDLLAQIDQTRKEAEDANGLGVQIELVTDAAFRTSFLSAARQPPSGPLPVLLLAADRVLPNGDAVCKLGSMSAAHVAHSMGAPVLVLTRIDRIHPSHMPDRPGVGPSAAKMTKEALVAGWKKLLRADAIDRFAGSSSVCFGVDGWETVEAKLVTCFVTELGVMELGRVQEVSKTLEKLEKLIWNDEVDDDDDE